MIGVGIIGLGYWGPNLLRNFADADGARVAAICDLRDDRLAAAAARHPGVATLHDVGEMLAHPAVDAVAIATPVSTHADIAMRALQAGKHVLVEKPMAASSADARRLIDEAARRKRVLMVDHTFVYTGAVQKIAALVSGGELGNIYYYDSVRVNLGLFQHDVNVIWDLAVPRRVGDRRQPRVGRPREHRVPDAVLRPSADRAHARQLAGARQDSPDAHRRQPADDRVRRSRAEREDQGLRQGHHRQQPAGQRLSDARRLPGRRHVGAASARHRSAQDRGRALRRVHHARRRAVDRRRQRTARRPDRRGRVGVDGGARPAD